jgi:hypothetical protein
MWRPQAAYRRSHQVAACSSNQRSSVKQRRRARWGGHSAGTVLWRVRSGRGCSIRASAGDRVVATPGVWAWLCRPHRPKHAIDVCPANAEPSRNIGRTRFLLVPKLMDGRGIDFRLPPLGETARPRCCNSFGLAFLPAGWSRTRRTPQPCRGRPARVDWLLSRVQRQLSTLQLTDDVLKILQSVGSACPPDRSGAYDVAPATPLENRNE